MYPVVHALSIFNFVVINLFRYRYLPAPNDNCSIALLPLLKGKRASSKSIELGSFVGSMFRANLKRKYAKTS